MKKLYTVLLIELVIVLILIVFIGARSIKKEWNEFIDHVNSTSPKITFVTDSISEAEAQERREKAREEILEYNKLLKEGKIVQETKDLGYVPGTYQFKEEQKELEDVAPVKVEVNVEAEITDIAENKSKYDYIYKEHEIEEYSTEQALLDRGIDLQEHAYSLWKNEYQGVLDNISFVAVNDHVYYLFTYVPGPYPTDYSYITADAVEYEKDAVYRLCKSRPVKLTIVYLSYEGDIIYEITN